MPLVLYNWAHSVFWFTKIKLCQMVMVVINAKTDQILVFETQTWLPSSSSYSSSKRLVELRFLFSKHQMTVLYICTKFYENIFNGFTIIELTQFLTEMGHNSVKKCRWFWFIFSSYFLMMLQEFSS